VNPQTGVAPYPAFGPVTWRGDAGNSTFHALQLNARRALQNGFLFSANYMWSHSINDASIGGGESDTPQDSFCRSCDKASSDDDVRQLFNLSAVYHLPFGAGRRFLSGSGFARTVLGGWTISAIGTRQTGLPFNITIDRSNGSVPGDLAISGAERPNYVYGVPFTPPNGSSPGEWVNPAAFATPASGTFGNLGRRSRLVEGYSSFREGACALSGGRFQYLQSRAIWRSQCRSVPNQFRDDYHHDQQLCHGTRNSAGVSAFR